MNKMKTTAFPNGETGRGRQSGRQQYSDTPQHAHTRGRARSHVRAEMIISVEHAAASLNADVYHADVRIYVCPVDEAAAAAAAHVGVRKGFQELDRRNVNGRRHVLTRGLRAQT